ncbi:RagB/SusD family nutrient uptake outer membrane protein [Maribacter sp.]|uniref:RagB/SusD family nutrient uptake outer membrane protein n=1 Tax=Maribacter sp. TaxID=1897614 RepID=UPI0032989A2C
MKKYIATIITFSLLLNACKTDDLELSNGSGVSAETFPQTLAELQQTMNGVYSPLQSQGLYGRYLFYMYDYMGDDCQTQRGTPDLLEFINYTFTSSNNDIYLYWKNAYNGISRANFILDKEANINELEESVASQEVKDRYIGQAKFLRAYYYFLLVERFGDIPLYTTTNVSPNGLAKSPKEEVYDLIISDLTDAATKLRLKSSEEAGRVTQGSANALLGKLYLYKQEYALAKVAFDKVINSGEYSLMANYYDNFNVETENNAESVFEIQFTYDGGNAWAYADWGGQDNGHSETTFRSAEYGAFGGFHNNDPSQELLDEYEDGDSRFSDNFYVEGDVYGIGGANIVTADQVGSVSALWRKYTKTYGQDNSNYNGLSDINHRAIRYADVLLMAAEVENELNNSQTAIDYLNEVRDRVNMPNYGTDEMNTTFPVSTKAEIFSAVVHERRVELAGEQSRFPDLMRWGLIEDVLGSKFNASKNYLLPIPQGEFDTNLMLDASADQNPGY